MIDTTPEFRIQCLRENIRWVDAVPLYPFACGPRHGAGRLPPLLRFARWTAPDLREPDDDGGSGAHLIPTRSRLNPCPKGYFVPEPHVVDGPFNWPTSRSRHYPLPHGKHAGERLPLHSAEPETARLPQRLQGSTRTGRWRQVRGSEVVVLDALPPQRPILLACAWTRPLTAARRIGPGARS